MQNFTSRSPDENPAPPAIYLPTYLPTGQRTSSPKIESRMNPQPAPLDAPLPRVCALPPDADSRARYMASRNWPPVECLPCGSPAYSTEHKNPPLHPCGSLAYSTEHKIPPCGSLAYSTEHKNPPRGSLAYSTEHQKKLRPAAAGLPTYRQGSLHCFFACPLREHEKIAG